MKIVAISGSLRKDSYNTKLVEAFIELGQPEHSIEHVSIVEVPMYDQDDEAEYPVTAQAFKDKIIGADGVIIVTPEYNRSIPGVLKNAIDWASRPYGKNAFAGKPVLIAGVSSGKIGTALAQSHLKEIMLYLDAKVVGQPELYIGPAGEVFDAEGKIQQESTKELLKKAVAVLASKA